MKKLSLIGVIVFFILGNSFAEEIEPNAKVLFNGTKILFDFKNIEKGNYIVNEGAMIRVSSEPENGWYKVIYENENMKINGYIKADDFQSLKFQKEINTEEKEETIAVEEKNMKSGATAINWSPDNSKNIYDIMYMPTSGTLFFVAGLNFSSGKNRKTYTSGGSTDDFNKLKMKQSNIGGEIGIALLDQLLIGLSIQHSIYYKYSFTYGPASSSDGTTVETKSEGFYDPTIYGKFRILEQEKKEINFDLIFKYSPSVFDAQVATEDSKGKVGRGGYGACLGFEFGKKFKKFTLAGELLGTFYGDREIVDKDYDEYAKVKEGHEIDLSFKYQYRFTTFFQMNLSAMINQELETRIKYEGISDEVKSSACMNKGFEVALNFNLIKEKMLLVLYYSYFIGEDFELTGGNDKFDVVDNKLSNYGIGLRVQF